MASALALFERSNAAETGGVECCAGPHVVG